MSQATTLYKLQSIEQQIIAAEARIAEIDQAIANNEQVQAAQQAVQLAEEALPPLLKQVREVEHELETTSAKAQETEDQLYSGSVTNTKAMQEMQQEITLLNEKKGQLEEATLGLMEDIEGAEAMLQQKQSDLEKIMQSQRHQHDALFAERDQKSNEVEQLEAQRQTNQELLDDETRQLYEQMKPRTRGRPVAKMHNDATCGLCGVQQNRTVENQVRRGEIVQCGNCRRILVFV